MRLLLVTLLLSVALPLLSSFVLESVDFDLDFDYPETEAELLLASGLSLNSELEMEEIQESALRLRDHFQSKGFYYVQIGSPELVPLAENRIAVIYHINRLVDTGRVRLSFTGNRYFSSDRLQDYLLLGDLEDLERIPQVLSRVVGLYNDRSYFFARAGLDSLVLEEGSDPPLRAVIGIDEGHLFRLQEIVCEGNLHTRASTLIRISGLRQLRMINPDALQEATQRIKEKSFIEDCEIIPLDASRLLIRIREGKMTYLEGVAGFNRVGGKSELNGLVNLSFQNLWGSDRSIGLFWKNLPELSSVLELAYHESGPSAYPVAGDLILNRSSQDSTWIKSRFLTDLYYYNRQHRFGLEFLLESIDPGSRRPILVESRSGRSLGVFWAYRNLDNRMNPSTGMDTELRYRFYLSAGEDEPGSALEAYTRHFIPLSRHWVGALSVNLKSLDRDPGNTISYFRMGGFKSLRGYREDTISGWGLLWTNAELRYRLTEESRIYLFYDHGIQMLEQEQTNYRLFSLGLGLSYRTRLGILRLDYALGYKDKNMWDFGLGIIHLGLDAAF